MSVSFFPVEAQTTKRKKPSKSTILYLGKVCAQEKRSKVCAQRRRGQNGKVPVAKHCQLPSAKPHGQLQHLQVDRPKWYCSTSVSNPNPTYCTTSVNEVLNITLTQSLLELSSLWPSLCIWHCEIKTESAFSSRLMLHSNHMQLNFATDVGALQIYRQAPSFIKSTLYCTSTVNKSFDFYQVINGTYQAY